MSDKCLQKYKKKPKFTPDEQELITVISENGLLGSGAVPQTKKELLLYKYGALVTKKQRDGRPVAKTSKRRRKKK